MPAGTLAETCLSLSFGLAVMLGAALFLVSDLMLAVAVLLRTPPTPWLSRAVWITYWLGQALIALGSGALGVAAPGMGITG